MSHAAIEETLNRIKTHKGVTGIVIVNADGVTLRSTLDAKITAQYASIISDLSSRAQNFIQGLDPQNDLSFLRIRTKKHEIMVSPSKDFLLIVIQDPNVVQEGNK
ncbi:putative dynein light chain roadblock-type 2 [Cardiosporidium cionae]|uniref:Dynein light chain roadblock n=1 Tax=Cardiosporidium cionae TaxID=476202 RepID=A0ABQ7J4K9_9APIC|nr:putative dynein light chain roadblock-type 2 [Cardiosporidium cionae]|eukprot:KAF8818041.1 putative dynein light chain roadblock-type 2 [Cardiosporidium cionae]